MDSVKRLGIIGAGPSGLISAKEALDKNLNVTIFEKSDQIGGIWSDYGYAWSSLETDISKYYMQLGNFKWPEHSMLYPKKKHVQDYLTAFAKNFNISNLIKFNHTVTKVNQEHDEKGETANTTITFQDNHGKQQTETFDFVIFSTGPYSIPDYAGFDKKYKGRENVHVDIVHSADFKQVSDYKGKRVMVIGHGNSAVYISSEIAKVSSSLINVFRTPRWIMERFIKKGDFYHPLEFKFTSSWKNRNMLSMLPLPGKNKIINSIMATSSIQNTLEQLYIETDTNYNRAGISDDYLAFCQNGLIQPVKAEVSDIRGKVVKLNNGMEFEVDILLLCTGYKADISILGDEILKKLEYNVSNDKFTMNYVYDLRLENIAFLAMNSNILLWICLNLQAKVAIQYFLERKGYEDYLKTLKKRLNIDEDKSNVMGYVDMLMEECKVYPDLDFIKEKDQELYDCMMNGLFLYEFFYMKKENYGLEIWHKSAEFIKSNSYF